MGLDARLAMGQENFNNLRNQVVFVFVKLQNQIAAFFPLTIIRGFEFICYIESTCTAGLWHAAAVSP